jgi:hypothetical protein
MEFSHKMKFSRKVKLTALASMFIVGIVLLALLLPSTFAGASRNPGPVIKHPAKGKGVSHLLRTNVPELPKIQTGPLGQPVNAPSVEQYKQSRHSKTSVSAKPSAEVSTLKQPLDAVVNLDGTCPSPTLDLKVLVIASDGNEADLPAIKQVLDYAGTPYTVYIAAQTPNGLTPDKLSSGCTGYYEGVILTNGTLSYSNNGVWTSALSQQEWTNLWTYESTFGAREVSWYTYPTSDFGYQVPSGAIDTTSTPLPTTLTTQGQSVFSYLNATTTVTIQNAYTYQALPLTDGATTPLLTDANGNALIAVRQDTDGRQILSQTFDSNANLVHTLVLSYGVLNWVTKGLFLGERHVYMSPQIDDLFIDGAEWVPSTPCSTPVDQTGYTYRNNATDWQTSTNWQASQRTSAITPNFTYTIAFNGYGTTPDAGYSPDTLTPAVKQTQSQYYWVSHTFDHLNLNNVSYATADYELTQNIQTATNTLHLTNFTKAAMVTPDVSGLATPNFLQDASANGIQYLVTDTSIPAYNNPSPQAGIYNTFQPNILMIPRRPTNLFYNVSTPDEWVAEYNCHYASYWGHNLTYAQILDEESSVILSYLLKGDNDPLMFHVENMRAYDGTHTLLDDLMNATLQKYTQYYNVPIQFFSMDKLGQKVANRMQYNAAGVTASIIPGVSITLTAQKAATVPVTGLKTTGAETYAGQNISYVTLAAGQSVTLPLS